MKNFILEIIHFQNLRLKHWLVIFAVYILVHIPAIRNDTGETNLAIRQAKAFLDNRADIPKYYWDVAVYEGKYYVSFPPFPAVVALPFVIIQDKVNSVLISLLLSCLSMYLFYRILQRVMPEVSGRKWIFLAYFFGTGYWYMVLTSHHINGFAHIVSSCLIMLLLFELTGKQRPVLIGLFLSATFLSRQMTLFYGILIIYFLFFEQGDKKIALRKLAICGSAFLVPALAYLYFNYIRFGDVFNTGYNYILYASPNGASMLKDRVESYGLFHIKYFWFNFYHMFLKGHNIIFTGNGLLDIKSIDLFGTSIIAASPFVVSTLKAKEKKGLIIACWLTFFLIMTATLFYHNNGWQQVNTQRFSLDFFPVLMLLAAWGYSSVPTWLFRLLVLYAVLLNCFSLALHLYLE